MDLHVCECITLRSPFGKSTARLLAWSLSVPIFGLCYIISFPVKQQSVVLGIMAEFQLQLSIWPKGTGTR